MTIMRYQKALMAAVRHEMEADDTVFYLGEDVEHSLRGISSGLKRDFPGRVTDTPISEAAFTGYATGAAMAGRRPIVEFQIPTLLYVAFDQIVNQAQKIRLMTGGQVKVPVTYLFPGSGARLGLAGQHSDHPYSLLAHAGVKTVVPATAGDAYELLRAAIREDDPVAVFAPAACLHRKSDVDVGAIGRLGSAAIARPGTSITVVTVGHLVHEAMTVAHEMADEVDLEVINSRSVFPFDWDLLHDSVARTHHLIVVDDANRFCGFAAEIAATASQELFMLLEGPIIRVTRAESTVPFALELERAVVPQASDITRAVHQMMTHFG